jgi:hypothetical protein
MRLPGIGATTATALVAMSDRSQERPHVLGARAARREFQVASLTGWCEFTV